MDEILLRRLVGLMTLAVAAFLLSWLLPRPGLQRLEGERLVTMDLTRPDSAPREQPLGEAAFQAPQATPDVPAEVLRSAPAPIPGAADEDSDAGANLPPPEVPAPESSVEARAATPAAVVAEPKHDAKPEAEPAPPPEPNPAAKAANPITPEARPAPAPVPKPPVTKPAPAKPAVPAAGSGSVVVQAGAYSFLDKAESVVTKARAGGVSCVVSPADTVKGTLYRVRCGPYPSRDSAEAAIKTLAKASIAAQVMPSARR